MYLNLLTRKGQHQTFSLCRKKGSGYFMGQFPFTNSVHPSKTSGNSRLTAETKEKNSKRLKRLLLPYLSTSGKYFIKLILQIMQPYESNKPWFTERLFLMCSLFLSLILNGLFASQLASCFSKRMYYEDIDTLEELEESGNIFRLNFFVYIDCNFFRTFLLNILNTMPTEF